MGARARHREWGGGRSCGRDMENLAALCLRSLRGAWPRTAAWSERCEKTLCVEPLRAAAEEGWGSHGWRDGEPPGTAGSQGPVRPPGALIALLLPCFLLRPPPQAARRPQAAPLHPPSAAPVLGEPLSALVPS